MQATEISNLLRKVLYFNQNGDTTAQLKKLTVQLLYNTDALQYDGEQIAYNLNTTKLQLLLCPHIN